MFFGGGGGGGGGGFGGAAGGGPRKSKPIMHKLAASLEDLYLGKKKKLAINREVACSGCDGKGGSKVETCSSCKGRGMKVITKQIGPGMIQQMQCPCDQCEATGEIISEAHKCKECKGKKSDSFDINEITQTATWARARMKEVSPRTSSRCTRTALSLWTSTRMGNLTKMTFAVLLTTLVSS